MLDRGLTASFGPITLIFHVKQSELGIYSESRVELKAVCTGQRGGW